MQEPETVGVQRRTGDEGGVLGAVEPVPGQRVAHGGEVEPQLVGAAGLQTAFNPGIAGIPAEHGPVRDRGAAVLPVDGHFFPVDRVPPDGSVYGARVLLQVPHGHRLVYSGQGVVLKLGGQGQVGFVVLGGDDQAGGVPVDAVDNARTQNAVDAGQAGSAVVEQGVDQGAVRMAGGGVDHHAHGLVHHDHVFVLVYHVQGDVLGLADYPEISHVQRFSTKPGMIKTDDAFQGMVLKGVGPEFDPHFIKEYLVEGEIPVFSDSVSTNQVLISKALATKMKLKLGDKIYTYYIQDDIRARRLTIAGIYQTNFSEYDNLFLLTDLNLVNRLNGWQPEQVTGVELQVKDYDKLEDITYEIATDIDNRQDELGGVYYVRNIEQLNPQIFAWLDLLDLNVWVILILMIGVAGFTMISGLLIIIIERTNMIGILKALGANNFTIRRTFLWFAVFLIGKGMLWGNAIGLAFCILQSQFGLFKLDPETYYVDTVPVSFNILLFVLINLGTLFASVLMLIGPSFLITKINPASSMRYE